MPLSPEDTALSIPRGQGLGPPQAAAPATPLHMNQNGSQSRTVNIGQLRTTQGPDIRDASPVCREEINSSISWRGSSFGMITGVWGRHAGLAH